MGRMRKRTDAIGEGMSEPKPNAGVLLGLAALNSFGGVMSAIKSGIPYESIRPALSKEMRYLFETPFDELKKDLDVKISFDGIVLTEYF